MRGPWPRPPMAPVAKGSIVVTEAHGTPAGHCPQASRRPPGLHRLRRAHQEPGGHSAVCTKGRGARRCQTTHITDRRPTQGERQRAAHPREDSFCRSQARSRPARGCQGSRTCGQGMRKDRDRRQGLTDATTTPTDLRQQEEEERANRPGWNVPDNLLDYFDELLG